jgi:hypothetical protein
MLTVFQSQQRLLCCSVLAQYLYALHCALLSVTVIYALLRTYRSVSARSRSADLLPYRVPAMLASWFPQIFLASQEKQRKERYLKTSRLR